MTEEMFWDFMEKELDSGRVPMMAMGNMGDGQDPTLQAQNDYFGGHSLLPKDYEAIPVSMLLNMSKLLFEKKVTLKAKRAILMILAHRGINEILAELRKYAQNPDPGLEHFAQLAAEECEFWID